MYNKLKKPLEFLDKISRGFLAVFQLYFVYIFKYNENRKNPKNHSKGGKNGREKVFNKEPFCEFFTCNCDGSDTFTDWGGTGKSRRGNGKIVF